MDAELDLGLYSPDRPYKDSSIDDLITVKRILKGFPAKPGFIDRISQEIILRAGDV